MGDSTADWSQQQHKEFPGPVSDDINQLKAALDSLTQSHSDDWTELVWERKNPVVLRRTKSEGVVIELQAKSEEGRRLEAFLPSDTVRHETIEHDVLKALEEFDAPAIPTDEVANQLKAPIHIIKDSLSNLLEEGKVEKKDLGDTVLWWPVTTESEPEDKKPLPEFVEEGLKKSQEDIKSWVERNKYEGESLEEAYERLRGSPSLEEAKRLIRSDGIESGELMRFVRDKREVDKNRKLDANRLFE